MTSNTSSSPFRHFNSSSEIRRLVATMYVRLLLSLRNVEDLPFERGSALCHETVRLWWNRFGPMFAAYIRPQRTSRMRGFGNRRWKLGEVFAKISGETRYTCCAVDHEGEFLESSVTIRRDRFAALRFLKEALQPHGVPWKMATAGLKSYPAAMRGLGHIDRREIARWLKPASRWGELRQSETGCY